MGARGGGGLRGRCGSGAGAGDPIGMPNPKCPGMVGGGMPGMGGGMPGTRDSMALAACGPKGDGNGNGNGIVIGVWAAWIGGGGGGGGRGEVVVVFGPPSLQGTPCVPVPGL